MPHQRDGRRRGTREFLRQRLPETCGGNRLLLAVGGADVQVVKYEAIAGFVF